MAGFLFSATDKLTVIEDLTRGHAQEGRAVKVLITRSPIIVKVGTLA